MKTRAEKATALCRRLNHDVAEIAPPGIGHWDDVWTMTASADTGFMLRLVDWERTGEEPERLALRDAYWGVLEAWRDAVRAYEREQQGAA
jgi:hypothetical protein